MLGRNKLTAIGLPDEPEIVKTFIDACILAAKARKDEKDVKNWVTQIINSQKPTTVLNDETREYFGSAAEKLELFKANRIPYTEREIKAPWKLWGEEDLDDGTLQQMDEAVSLPISIGGALMPDAHKGYGLPIGGVLATKDAVIPYAVGVDIACRMRISILDTSYEDFEKDRRTFGKALFEETRFGVGAHFNTGERSHEVMDDPLWQKPGVLSENYQKALAQLGTSGHGNHFVEFGKLTVDQDIDEPTLKVKAGTYVALLSHSGSRGLGKAVADHYSTLALQLHPGLPDNLKRLAWLELDSREGQDYWDAMELCGRYAAANHELIHKYVLKFLGIKPLGYVENHHNFAWKEVYDGEELIVHRKGATPASLGKLGVVPGSMASPGFIVRGKGNPQSYNSCSHGAGRLMSRTQAFKSLTHSAMKKILEEKGITLLAGPLDEAPQVYKDIEKVISSQKDLVDVLARFDPKVVLMANDSTTKWRKSRARREKEKEREQETCL